MAKKETKKPEQQELKATVDLVAIADELNVAWGLAPAIDTTDEKKLKKHIIKEADGTLTSTDKELLLAETWEFLTVDCGIEPVEAEPAPAPEKPTPKADKPKKSGGKSNLPKRERAQKYCREHACWDTLNSSKKHLTIDEWAEKANAAYIAKGGSDNLRQTKHIIDIVLRNYLHSGHIAVDGDKYSVVK